MKLKNLLCLLCLIFITECSSSIKKSIFANVRKKEVLYSLTFAIVALSTFTLIKYSSSVSNFLKYKCNNLGYELNNKTTAFLSIICGATVGGVAAIINELVIHLNKKKAQIKSKEVEKYYKEENNLEDHLLLETHISMMQKEKTKEEQEEVKQDNKLEKTIYKKKTLTQDEINSQVIEENCKKIFPGKQPHIAIKEIYNEVCKLIGSNDFLEEEINENDDIYKKLEYNIGNDKLFKENEIHTVDSVFDKYTEIQERTEIIKELKKWAKSLETTSVFYNNLLKNKFPNVHTDLKHYWLIYSLYIKNNNDEKMVEKKIDNINEDRIKNNSGIIYINNDFHKIIEHYKESYKKEEENILAYLKKELKEEETKLYKEKLNNIKEPKKKLNFLLYNNERGFFDAEENKFTKYSLLYQIESHLYCNESCSQCDHICYLINILEKDQEMIQVFHDPESKAFENFNFIIEYFLDRKEFFESYTKEEKEAYAQRINKKIDIFIKLIDRINTNKNQNIKDYFVAIRNHFKNIGSWLKETWMKDDKATIESFCNYNTCPKKEENDTLKKTIYRIWIEIKKEKENKEEKAFFQILKNLR